MKTEVWQPLEKAKWCRSFSKASFPESCHYLTCLLVSCLHWLDSELTNYKRGIFPQGHLWKIFRGNCLTSWLPEILDNSCGKPKTKKKKQRNDMYTGLWKAPVYPGHLGGHALAPERPEKATTSWWSEALQKWRLRQSWNRPAKCWWQAPVHTHRAPQ